MMRVTFRKMNEAEFIGWKEWSIADYANSLILSGQCSENDARTEAEEEFSGLIDRADTHLLIAENDKHTPIGMVWYEAENPERAFILDFAVYENYRRMGYGSAILTELERTLKLMNIPAMELHVFKHNNAAVRLYEKYGFTAMDVDDTDEGSLYMIKKI